MVAFFRVHWLPIDYYEKNIQEFLVQKAPYMKVMEIKKETLLADKGVLNGIIKIKIEYKVEDHSRVLDFAGL